jgi:hypothetical protein
MDTENSLLQEEQGRCQIQVAYFIGKIFGPSFLCKKTLRKFALTVHQNLSMDAKISLEYIPEMTDNSGVCSKEY